MKWPFETMIVIIREFCVNVVKNSEYSTINIKKPNKLKLRLKT